MGCDEINKKQVECPCKKGLVVKTSYQTKNGKLVETVNIKCKECSDKYNVIKKDDGFYLLPKNSVIQPQVVKQVKNITIEQALVREFNKTELNDILNEYENSTRVKEMVDDAGRAAKLSKDITGSAIRENIIKYLKQAISIYDDTAENADAMRLTAKINKEVFNIKLAESNKHLIKLEF